MGVCMYVTPEGFLPVITEGSHDLQVYMYTWGCLESSWGGLEVLRKQS